MPNPNEQKLLDFLACAHRFDVEGQMAFISDDAVFEGDLKGDIARGRDEIRALWTDYAGRITSYDAEVKNVLASDRVGFIERIEHMMSKKGYMMVLPVAGIVEFDPQGRITAWRDYWDSSMLPPPAAG